MSDVPTEAPPRKLLGVIEVRFKLINKTGLLIMAPQAKMMIGGADRQPIAVTRVYKIDGNEIAIKVPYIPGSSLKGRIRSLLEVYEGVELHTTDGKIYMHIRDLRSPNYCQDLDHALDNLFGSPATPIDDLLGHEATKPLAGQVLKKYAPTRLLMEDMYPSENYVEKLYREKMGGAVMFDDFLEEKQENRIDRITSTADPRTIYRVKPGVEFDGVMRILIYNVDSENNVKEYLRLLATGMRLLEDTYLGSSGTRGYGRVVFSDIRLLFKTRNYYKTGRGEEIVEIGVYDDTTKLLSNLREAAEKILSLIKESP